MTITSHFNLPAGQFPLYSGMTGVHIANLEILRSTKTQVVMVVVESALARYKLGSEMRFFKSNGRLVDYEIPSLRNYIASRDFDTILDLVEQADAEAEVERLCPIPIRWTYLVSWDRKTVINELDDGAEDLVTLGYRVVAATKGEARSIVKAYRDGLEWANDLALQGSIQTITKKIDEAQDRAEASLAAVATEIQMIAQPVQQQQGRAPRVMFTMDQITEAMSEDSGFCIKCGGQTDDTVEPDARGYRCPHCDAMAVYGAEELLIMGRVA
jgi:hypothetical protein